VYAKEVAAMETQKVGIREFREKLATYVLESEGPMAITRHGDTVGYYIPARRKRTEAEKAAFLERAKQWQKELDAAGVDEDEVLEEFQRLRRAERERQAA
jgi:PHD/YefM family antitoxin component YafN of YafNO toxin-antitoxin module